MHVQAHILGRLDQNRSQLQVENGPYEPRHQWVDVTFSLPDIKPPELKKGSAARTCVEKAILSETCDLLAFPLTRVQLQDLSAAASTGGTVTVRILIAADPSLVSALEAAQSLGARMQAGLAEHTGRLKTVDGSTVSVEPGPLETAEAMAIASLWRQSLLHIKLDVTIEQPDSFENSSFESSVSTFLSDALSQLPQGACDIEYVPAQTIKVMKLEPALADKFYLHVTPHSITHSCCHFSRSSLVCRPDRHRLQKLRLY